MQTEGSLWEHVSCVWLYIGELVTDFINDMLVMHDAIQALLLKNLQR